MGFSKQEYWSGVPLPSPIYTYIYIGVFIYVGVPGGSDVKNLPAMWETWLQSQGREDSSGEENGNPLQYSGLENPLERGAWLAIVHGIAESDTTERLTHRCLTSHQRGRSYLYDHEPSDLPVPEGV